MGGGKDGQGDRHGGHGTADEGAGGGSEGERERRVAERGDAVGGEDHRTELALERVGG
jgi:hypothetical protein